jgi:hypothetical protein
MTVTAGGALVLLGGQTLGAGDVDQFTVAIDPDTINEEIVFITNVTSDTITIVRGRAGTSAITHSTGATVRHVLTSNDLDYFTAGVDNSVAKTGAQTIAGVKTFSNSPVISTITNTGTLTLPTSTDTLVGRATTDTLTNKTLTAPVVSTIVNTGTLTLPTSTDTLVGRATTDTLTNKTLTAPIISTISNTGTITLPTSTDTLVGKATTDTLTNKTFDTAGTGNVLRVNGTGITDKTGTGNVVLGTSPAIATPTITSPTVSVLSLSAGTATAGTAPVKIASGTNLTSPEAGAIEYDGNAAYLTTSTSHGRGISPSIIIATNSTAKSLSSATTANQPLFATPTTGAITVAANTTYIIEGFFSLTTGTVSHTTAFSPLGTGTASISSIAYYATFVNTSVNGNTTGTYSSHITQATSTTLISASSTSPGAGIFIKGIVRTGTSGTMIPGITFSAAPGGTNTVSANSYFSLTPIGSSSVTAVGAWA